MTNHAELEPSTEKPMTETLRDKLIRCGWVTNFNADTLVQLIERHYAALAQPEPMAPVWADIHYAWELLDAEGEWQAGGSTNSLDDVRREGNHYLQTYAQDGPHKLIIQRHCVNTIEEVTND